MSEKTELIAKWCTSHAQSVLWDAPTTTLHDVFSGKSLRIDLTSLSEVDERTAADTGEDYLLLVMEDGRQLALAQAGIAFPPDMTNSGPLPGMPDVVCWRDFAMVTRQIEHAVFEHPELETGREVLDMILYCIALIDGARGAGFDVGEQERIVEGYLDETERRAGKK